MSQSKAKGDAQSGSQKKRKAADALRGGTSKQTKQDQPERQKDLVKEASEVVKPVERLAERMEKEEKERRERLARVELPERCKEVVDMDQGDVVDRVEQHILAAAMSILRGNAYSFSVPLRGEGNQMFVPELDRIVLKDKRSKRSFDDLGGVYKTTVMTRVLQLVHEICTKGIHVTKRDLFYTDAKLFHDQRRSDGVLDDISCMVGCTRTSLNVVASEKGVVVGRLTFREDGDLIDCTKMGVGGKAIPPNIDKVSHLDSDAKFILLVEKDAAFMRLAEDRFYNR